MKKLLAPLALLFLVACQPSELERCIEANIPDVIVPDNQEIISDVMDAYEIVLPDTAKQQYKDAMIAMIQIEIEQGYYADEPIGFVPTYENWKERMIKEGRTLKSIETGIRYQETVADLIEEQEYYEDTTIEDNTYPWKLYWQNILDYNIKYYGLTDENILKAYFEEIELTGKETATSICNAQGIY